MILIERARLDQFIHTSIDIITVTQNLQVSS